MYYVILYDATNLQFALLGVRVISAIFVTAGLETHCFLRG